MSILYRVQINKKKTGKNIYFQYVSNVSDIVDEDARLIILTDSKRMQLIIRILYADVLTTNMKLKFHLKLIKEQLLVPPNCMKQVMEIL